MNKQTIVTILFIVILITSLILSWVMDHSEFTSNNSGLTINQDIPKPTPNIYWSKFNQSIIDLEREYTKILQNITPVNTKLVADKTLVTKKITKTPRQNINWSDIGKNLLESEQLRKNIIELLQEQN
ncbi:MAG: hypothetical protein KAG43_08005 [Candidatus Marithrix sp.]|nr:hypothetical protein [Candidatus Marithrix sp.]